MTLSRNAARTYWEEVASTRWGNYVTSIEKWAILQAHELRRKKPTIALEIGCEGGRWSKTLADIGWQMVCTDIDEAALRLCKQKVPSATFILADSANDNIPYKSQDIDLLLCIEVRPVIQADRFIPESLRVLRKDGLIVGVFWNLLSLRGIFAHIKNYGKPWDVYTKLYVSWRKKLISSGYRMLHEEGLCWGPFGRDSNSILIPLFTKLEEILGLRKLAALSPWVVFVAQKV